MRRSENIHVLVPISTRPMLQVMDDTMCTPSLNLQIPTNEDKIRWKGGKKRSLLNVYCESKQRL